MSKDGINRGGRRVRAGAKPEALNDKLAAGRPATRLTTPAELDVFDLDGTDIGDGALLAGEPMPRTRRIPIGRAARRPAARCGADLVYRETWNWLDERGCTEFVSKRLIEQCEPGVRPLRPVRARRFPSSVCSANTPPQELRSPARSWPCRSRSASRPTCTGTGTEIFDIVRATCTTDYSGTTPGDEVMEQLLKASS